MVPWQERISSVLFVLAKGLTVVLGRPLSGIANYETVREKFHDFSADVTVFRKQL